MYTEGFRSKLSYLAMHKKIRWMDVDRWEFIEHLSDRFQFLHTQKNVGW